MIGNSAEMIEKIPATFQHPAMIMDTLSDLVFEAYSELKITVTTSTALTTTKVIEYLMAKAPDHPAMANRTDTLGHAVLSIALNKSPESMTAVAKRYVNPNTGKPYTRAAISKQVNDVYDRLGIRSRSQKSDKARESYRKRAYRVHAQRRREAPKFNMAALKKGIKK